MNPEPRTIRPTVASDASDVPDLTWQRQKALVPAEWASGTYRLDQAPFNEVFVRNTNYLRSQKLYEFVPVEYARLRDECAWWLWSIWADGSRKIDPAMLTWWGRAITTLAAARAPFAGAAADASVTDFDPALVIREAMREFHTRKGRYPSPGNLRNLESAAHSIHAYVSVRCTDTPWCAHDTWNMRLDNRIPRRAHEPHADRIINLASIEPEWLRDGVRYWLSQSLILDQYTWTTACTRATSVGTRFGAFCQERGITYPAVADTLPGLRATFMDYLSFLRSPATGSGEAMAATGVNACQSHIQSFYSFMADNAEAAAEFTGDARWGELTVNHTRLWAPGHTPKRAGNKREVRYYTTGELGRLLAHLPVLAASTRDTLTIEHEGVTHTYRGLGDPQAARIWEIQALTGRRASEICMLDRQPLTHIDFGGEPASGPADPGAFVARLRYQQTKIDGVDPTILVTQAVVTIIEEQQAWLAEHRPEAADGKHLFVQPRGNTRGLNPRTYRSYADALKRLNSATNLIDDSGKPLVYTETHRLRHTRATTLLNDGVPVHVLQRYLGHRSPEMSMRYAQTLDTTARDAFLKHKQVGADGREVTIAPQDLIDLQQLDRRADRALPNGLCLLPPTKTCDKGNACLPCGSFATDATYLDEHTTQRDRIAALIQVRQAQFERRHGTPMPDTNPWLAERLRELASLDAIITRLEQDDARTGSTVKGAGASGKTTPLTLTTDPTRRDAARQALTDRLNPHQTP